MFSTAAVLLSATLALTACGGGDPLTCRTTSAAPSGSAPASRGHGRSSAPSTSTRACCSAPSTPRRWRRRASGRGEAGIGSREVVYDQVKSGGLTVLPEYNGNLLAFVDPKTTAATTEEVNAGLKEKLPAELEVLDSAAAEDKDTLTITKETATKNALTTMEDLAKVSKDFVVGGPPEFKKRWEASSRTPTGWSSRSGSRRGRPRADAIKDGTIQVGNVFTTDPKMPSTTWCRSRTRRTSSPPRT